MLGRNQEVDVTKDTPTRFIQHEVSQRLITGDESGLLPQAVPRGRTHAPDNNITDFTFRMATYDMYDSTRTHGSPVDVLRRFRTDLLP